MPENTSGDPEASLAITEKTNPKAAKFSGHFFLSPHISSLNYYSWIYLNPGYHPHLRGRLFFCGHHAFDFCCSLTISTQSDETYFVSCDGQDKMKKCSVHPSGLKHKLQQGARWLLHVKLDYGYTNPVLEGHIFLYICIFRISRDIMAFP